MLKWKINNIHYRDEYLFNNNLAKTIKDMSFDEISKNYTDINVKSIEHLLKISKDLYSCFIGKGIDLGGGIGSVSSVIAKSEIVENIICLELAENCVKYCHPKVIKSILKDNSNKVTSVVGEFDNIELEENSLDFAIAWDSFHHSNNLIQTLAEVKRVLKKDGHLIIVDRAHQNSTSEDEINKMLNIKYSAKWLKENYLPEDKILTRKDNGEHEYRFRDWENYFYKSAFKIVDKFVVRENGSGKNYFENDFGLKEYFIDYDVSGFEKRKVVYLLRK